MLGDRPITSAVLECNVNCYIRLSKNAVVVGRIFSCLKLALLDLTFWLQIFFISERGILSIDG